MYIEYLMNVTQSTIMTLETCYFEASEDIMTKFKSQALHIIRLIQNFYTARDTVFTLTRVISNLNSSYIKARQRRGSNSNHANPFANKNAYAAD